MALHGHGAPGARAWNPEVTDRGVEVGERGLTFNWEDPDSENDWTIKESSGLFSGEA